MDALSPPIPPQIAQQQAGPSPMMQFAQGGGQASAPQQPAQDPAMGLAQQLLDQIAGSLDRLATVLNATRPELIAVLKPAVQSLAMVSSNIKAAQGGAPSGGDQGSVGNGAPGAPGPVGMGMGQ